MSEKGSYAHVGLPGLRELFSGGARKTKDDAKQTTKEIQRIFESQAENGYRFISLEAVDVKFLFQQLTEKDATIEKLQDMSQRWKKAFTNADKQYLKKEKEAAELRRMIEGRDERLGIALDEAKRLRKALEEARSVMEDALSIGEARHSFDQALCPWCDLIMGVEAINAALGEGDKHE